jgi:hypothetical protein
VCAQEKIVIPLKLNLEHQQFSGMIIAERTADGPITYTTPAGDGVGHAPESVLFKLTAMEGSLNTYRLLVDANGDGNPANDTPQTLAPNSSLVVGINQVGQRKTNCIALFDQVFPQHRFARPDAGTVFMVT